MKLNLSTIPISAVAGATALFSLIAGTVTVAAPAQAATFDTTGIEFDQNTTVDFTFVKSQGKNQSTLSIVDESAPSTPIATLFAENAPGYDPGASEANDWQGTPGVTVLNPTNSFTFLAGQVYSLALSSLLGGKDAGTVYSTTSLNSSGEYQAIFTPTTTGTQIRFDDRGNNNDRDFNDFTITASTKATPEPAALAGLGLVAGGLLVSSRRRVGKKA